MAENNNIDQVQSLRNQQADAFLLAIHAKTLEEKGDILQKHPELIHIVDYYNMDLKTHANNKKFQEKLESGEYERNLWEEIKNGHLNRYDLPIEAQANNHLTLANKDYDATSKLLTGFDINLGNNQKPLHIDLKNYFPDSKSLQEIQQIRENFYDVYQSAINRNPEHAEKSFEKTAQVFPDGISWLAPGQELKLHPNAHTLSMQGVENLGVIASKGYGEAFIRMHDDRADMQFKNREIDNLKVTLLNLQGVAATINQGEYFTEDQKDSLNKFITGNLNPKENLHTVLDVQLG